MTIRRRHGGPPGQDGAGRLVHPSLLVLTGLSAISAIGGGIGLLVNGLGMPRAELDGTPFDSFVVPGALLAIVVGGSLATATVSLLRRVPWQGRVALVSGAVMLGWIAVEAFMVHDGRALQAAVAIMSLLIMLLGWVQMRRDEAI